MPENTVYVGRGSRWGNPYLVKDFGREDAVLFFKKNISSMKEDELKDFLEPLRGKNLACWCKPDEICHADVLLDFFNRHEGKMILEKEFLEIQMDPFPKPRMTSRSSKFSPVAKRYFAKKAELILRAKGFQLPASLTVTFIIAMPDSWTKKRKDFHNGLSHQQRPDLDNLVKALQDCLCEDDSYIYEYVNIRKIWGDHGRILIRKED